MRYVFGPYTLDLTHYELRQTGRLVRLEPRVFDLLAYFVQHPGRTVTTEELLEQLYPHQFAPLDRLTNAVTQARKALGDTGQTQQYIQTVRRRGYRFIAPVSVQPQAETEAPSPPLPDTPLPAEGLGQDRPDAEAPPPPVQSPPLSAPPSTLDPASAPRTTRPITLAAERRRLTVLVCRLVGVSERAKRLDPEELLAVVQDYHTIGAEVIQRFDGHIAQYQGDRLVVYFGYPQAHEDDARRAIHTGLGLVERMAELNRRRTRAEGVQLAVRVGIHTGVVVVGAMGQDAHAPLALGETPTIAAQVQDLAAPDTVVISSATLRLVERYADTRALGAHMLGDPAELLAVYQLLQERPAPSPFEGAVAKGLTPLVGREHEVGLLCERWAHVKDGFGQVVLLSGEAGIGKSRLVQALTEHLTGEAHTHVECRCLPYYQNTAFYPVVTHLQRFLRFTREDTAEEMLRKLEEMLEPYGFALEEVVPLLATLLSLPLPDRYPSLTLTPQRQKQKTLEALLAWLLAEAEQQPVCFVMEDLHWVDASTLEWLSLLINQVAVARLLVLLTFRPDFHPSWVLRSPFLHLTLGRLTHRQVEVMIRRVAGGKALPAEMLQQLVAKTDGVPLFVEELTKMVLESGLVKEQEGQYELMDARLLLEIPATLHDSLMARLDRLETAKQVAQLGAVIGKEFPYEFLQAVSTVDEATLQQELSRLVDAELLYQRGLLPQVRYVFKHALVQEAAYQSLLRSTRQQYHRQIAQMLEAQFPETCESHPELVAHHYTEADWSAQAIPYWQLAGQRAMARSAYIESVTHLTRALEVLKALPETSERIQQELALQLALGAAHSILKGFTAPEMEQAYSRARELCQQVGDSPQRFTALAGLTRVYRDRAELKTAQELGEQLLILAQSMQDSTFLTEAYCHQGITLWHFGEFAPALAHLEQGIAHYDSQKHHSHVSSYWHPVMSMTCFSYAARSLWILGYPDQALRKDAEALTLARQLSQPFILASALNYAATLHVWRREAQLVQEQAEATIGLSRKHGFIRWLSGGLIRKGWALAKLGWVEEGLRQLCQGIATWREMGTKLAMVLYLTMLADAYKTGGQAEAGLRVLTEALAIVHTGEEHCYDAELYRLRGELLLEEDKRERLEEAEESFWQALDIARHQSAKSLELRAAVSLCNLWQKQGKRAEACQMLTEIYNWFTEGFDTPDLREAKAVLEALQ